MLELRSASHTIFSLYNVPSLVSYYGVRTSCQAWFRPHENHCLTKTSLAILDTTLYLSFSLKRSKDENKCCGVGGDSGFQQVYKVPSGFITWRERWRAASHLISVNHDEFSVAG